MKFEEAVKLRAGTCVLYQFGGRADRTAKCCVVRVDKDDADQTLKAECPDGARRWLYNRRIISLAENQK